MKHLYILFILLVPVSGYSQKNIEYIEQYVEIINNISQNHYSEYPDDQSVIYFTFNTDSFLVDTLLEKAIRERVKDSRCIVRFPDKNAPVYLLGSPSLLLLEWRRKSSPKTISANWNAMKYAVYPKN